MEQQPNYQVVVADNNSDNNLTMTSSRRETIILLPLHNNTTQQQQYSSSSSTTTTTDNNNIMLWNSICTAFSSWSLLLYVVPPSLSRNDANRYRMGLCVFVVLLALSASLAHLRSIISLQSSVGEDRRIQQRLYGRGDSSYRRRATMSHRLLVEEEQKEEALMLDLRDVVLEKGTNGAQVTLIRDRSSALRGVERSLRSKAGDEK